MDGGNEAGEAQKGPSDVKGRVLGDHVTLQRGISYKSCLLDRPGPYLLGLGTIGKNGGFRGDSLRTYGGDSPEKLILMPGDLYISLKDVTQTGDLLGAVSRVPPSVAEGRLTQDTVKLIFKDDTISKDYVYWVLRTPQYRAYCKNRGTGTTNLDLSRNDFLIFPIPELTADRAGLVDIFEAVEGKIELNRRMNATLEAMARALFRSWFVDFDPVRAKAEGREPSGMDAATAALFPDEFEGSELGEIPKGWSTGPVLNHAELLSGGTPKTECPDYWNGEISWASAKDVSQCRQTFLIATERKITKQGLDESATQLIPELSTVIVARGATTGRMVLFGREMAMNQTCYALVSTKDTPFFLYCQFQHEIEALVHAAHGSVFDTITTSTLANSKVLLAPEPILKAFERAVFPLFQRILLNSEESLVLAALRDSLLPKLISGEVRVPADFGCRRRR